MTLGEAAKRLGVCRHTARAWIKKYGLPARKIGNLWIVLEADLEEFVRGGYSDEARRVRALTEGICQPNAEIQNTGKSKISSATESVAERRTARQPQRSKPSTARSDGSVNVCREYMQSLTNARNAR